MLEVDRVRRTFGDQVAVDDVSFTVQTGGMTGFVGGNGAGKTTTMRMIMGVLALHGGEVRWHGHPITASDRRHFGYMPEERGLYPKQKIVDQLVYLGTLGGVSASAARSRVLDLLDRFGLADRADDRVEKLSLGNQQRVQIIAAVLTDPDALILDEPFSGLDPTAVDAMAELLREHTERGAAVLFSSHQLDLVERLCDSLVILSRGRVVASGTGDELRATAASRHRLTLEDDAAWVAGVAGIIVDELAGARALIRVQTPGAERQLLTEAAARGRVLEFTPVVPSLADIYREKTR